MAIDFSLSPELEDIRIRVRTFIDAVVKPGEAQIHDNKLDETDRAAYVGVLMDMRKKAFKEGLWLPTCPRNWAAWA